MSYTAAPLRVRRMAGEFYSEVAEALDQAKTEFESEWQAPSDDTGAKLIAAAITLAGARVAFQLVRIAGKT